MSDFPVYLAHDHTQRAEDYLRDLQGGVTGKILHLTIDSWIEAPTKKNTLKPMTVTMVLGNVALMR